MKRRFSLLAALTTGALMLAPLAASAAGWKVDATRSQLNFVTAKAPKAGTTVIEEVQSFKQFQGGVDAAGKLVFTVELASAATGVPLRDQRIGQMLFKGEAAKASFSASVDAAKLAALKPGQSAMLTVDGTLSLNGQSQPLQARLLVSALAGGTMQVSTAAPVVVDLQKFGLGDGVQALREVMSLDVLSASAPVSFALTLTPAG